MLRNEIVIIMKNIIYTLILSGVVFAFGAATFFLGLTWGAAATGILTVALLYTGGAGAKFFGCTFKPGVFLAGLVAGTGLLLGGLSMAGDEPEIGIQTPYLEANDSSKVVRVPGKNIAFDKLGVGKLYNLKSVGSTNPEESIKEHEFSYLKLKRMHIT